MRTSAMIDSSEQIADAVGALTPDTDSHRQPGPSVTIKLSGYALLRPWHGWPGGPF